MRVRLSKRQMLILLEGKAVSHDQKTFILDPDDKETKGCLEILVRDDELRNKLWLYIDTETGIIKTDEELS